MDSWRDSIHPSRSSTFASSPLFLNLCSSTPSQIEFPNFLSQISMIVLYSSSSSNSSHCRTTEWISTFTSLTCLSILHLGHHIFSIPWSRQEYLSSSSIFPLLLDWIVGCPSSPLVTIGLILLSFFVALNFSKETHLPRRIRRPWTHETSNKHRAKIVNHLTSVAPLHTQGNPIDSWELLNPSKPNSTEKTNYPIIN